MTEAPPPPRRLNEAAEAGHPGRPMEGQPEHEVIVVTREMKQWARGILETMNTVVANHGAEPSDELMVFLGRIAFGALGSSIPAATWCRYSSVIAESGFGTEWRSRSHATLDQHGGRVPLANESALSTNARPTSRRVEQ